MAKDKGPRIEGCGALIWNDEVQKAIERATATFGRRFGGMPTHVALPPNVDPSGLRLDSLNLGHPSGPGVVIVGRPAANGYGVVDGAKAPQLRADS
jgi:hypothetical protein